MAPINASFAAAAGEHVLARSHIECVVEGIADQVGRTRAHDSAILYVAAQCIGREVANIEDFTPFVFICF